jgi:Fe-S-cluster-containing hydrogenase component 2
VNSAPRNHLHLITEISRERSIDPQLGRIADYNGRETCSSVRRAAWFSKTERGSLETWRIIVVRPEIDWLICEGCDTCQARLACKTRAIVKIDTDEPVFIELKRCNGCAKCVPACPYGAIVMKNGT